MAYERIKTVYGRHYRYIVEGKRIYGKVRQRVIKYLGPVNPVYKRKRNRSDNSWIFVHDMRDNEKCILEKSKYSFSAFTRDRAKIILLSAEKFSCKSIADKLNCGVRKVRKAIKEFNKTGVGCLGRKKAKGAEPTFTKKQRAKMLEVVSTDPVKLRMHFTTWTLRKLKRYFKSKSIVENISIASIRNILKSEGMNWKKSKRFQYSNDPEFVKKNF